MRSFLKNNRKNLVDGGDKRDGLGVKQAVHREERKAEEETDCVGERMESSLGTHRVGEKDREWLKAPSFLLSLFRPWMVSSEFSIYQIRLTFRNLGGKGHVLLI